MHRNLPIAICKYCLAHSMENQLKLLMSIKFEFSGKFKASKHNYEILADELGITSRTVENLLRKLCSIRWICKNESSGIYHVLSMRNIMKYVEGKGFKSNYTFRLEKEMLCDIKCMAFLIAVESIIRENRSPRRWLAGQRKKDKGPNKPTKASRFYDQQLAINSIAKILKLSRTKVINLKKLCIMKGYLLVSKSYKSINWTRKDLMDFRKVFPNESFKYRMFNGSVVEMQPDLFDIKLDIRKLRKNWTPV